MVELVQKKSIVWACEKFATYLRTSYEDYIVHLETDHKPLVPLLGKTYLPPQIVRFQLHLMQFNYTISHVPGKMLYTADTLSHAPVDPADQTAPIVVHTEMFLKAVVSHLPISKTI